MYPRQMCQRIVQSHMCDIFTLIGLSSKAVEMHTSTGYETIGIVSVHPNTILTVSSSCYFFIIEQLSWQCVSVCLSVHQQLL